ncbi:MAG: NUDIX hydrolase [Cyanobacteria bacterium P01_G01_bin.49]
MNSQANTYIEQSAVIPYRFHQGQLQILLITTRKKKRWIIPKGLIEPDMTPQASAAQEALEEAGIKGKVEQPLMGTYTYQKWGRTCRVQIFLLAVESLYIDWLEASFRQREWVSLHNAIERVQEVKIKEILENLPNYLN